MSSSTYFSPHVDFDEVVGKWCFCGFENDLTVSSAIDLVKKRGKKNLRIVLKILGQYDGQPFLHPVLKEIVGVYHMDEKLRENLYHILSETGALMGEYGFCDALKQKMEETRDWLTDANAEIKEFASEYHKHLDKLIACEKDKVERESTFRRREFEIAHK